MDVDFADPDLERLADDHGFNAGFGIAVVRGYRKVIQFIRAARDERDFWQMRSLRFEKLKGDRNHQHSFRINDQWRVIVVIQKSTPKNTIRIIEIADYH